MEDKPKTSKFQALSMFDYDNPKEAKQEKPFTLRNQLYFFHSQMWIKEENKLNFMVSIAIIDMVIKTGLIGYWTWVTCILGKLTTTKLSRTIRVLPFMGLTK
jgi:hypothetical protein